MKSFLNPTKLVAEKGSQLSRRQDYSSNKLNQRTRKMISEQTSCFDQNNLLQSDQDGSISKEQSFTHQNLSSTSALEMEIQSQLNLEIENCYNNNNNDQTHNMVQQEIVQNPNLQEMNSFAAERHRRLLLNDKYQALRKLIPNPTKVDRASIVGDAINYINELKRTLNELKILIEKKRCAREAHEGKARR